MGKFQWALILLLVAHDQFFLEKTNFMFNKFSKALVAATLLIASVGAQASLISIDTQFTFGWGGNRSNLGSIQGTDFNSDGIISTNEVTSIYESYSGHSVLSTLSAIGDINISAVTWTPNALSWTWASSIAYMTFDNRAWSCSTYNGCGITFTSFKTSGDVPEPATLALFGLGLLGFAAARRRKQ